MFRAIYFARLNFKRRGRPASMLFCQCYEMEVLDGAGLRGRHLSRHGG